MEFGRVPQNELNNVDFNLQIDPGFNKMVLKTGASIANLKVVYRLCKMAQNRMAG